MNTELQTQAKPLYESDFLQWIETTAQQLKDKDFSNVDWENLIEEIETMGRSERRGLKSNLVILLLHLLKWQYQPEQRSGSWSGSIVEHRRRIRDRLEDSPSLRPYLNEVISKCYADAIEQAAAETGLAPETFPSECPYTIAEILDTNFPSESL